MMDGDRQFTLVQHWKQGSEVAFQELYTEFVSPIYKFIYYRTFHKQLAEDVTNEVFVKALSKIGQFDESKGTFQSWLYGIARNAVVDHYRTRKETVDLEDAREVGVEQDLDGHVDRVSELADVKKYLEALPEDQREIIYLRVWDDLNYQQIAEIVGKSEAACKMTFSRAIGKLRKEMPLVLVIILLLYS